MFDKFGEMSSYKEINTLAENLFNENDIENLKEMAKENGIAIKNAYTAMRQDNRCQKNRSLTLKAGKRSSVHAGKQELPN